MFISLRAALLASVLMAIGPAVVAEPIALADALRTASQNSPRIAQSKAQAAAAEARARQAGVPPNPELGVEIENFAGSGPYRDFRSAETTLAISQRIELGGKRGARLAVAAAERDAALLVYKRAFADLDRDVRVAHAELRAAEDTAAQARDAVGSAQELAKTARILVDAGRDPPLRQLRAEALLATAKAEQARTFGQLLTARRLLATLVGSDDSELSAIATSDEIAPANLPADIVTLDEQLAVAEREAARARIRVAKADAVPDVTASGGVRRFGEGQETAVIAGVSIALPFRDRNRGNIEAAQSDSLALEAGLALARQDASRARYDAQIKLGAAEVRYEALAGPGISQAEEAIRLARIGYRAGKFSLIELLDAQSALNAAKLTLIEARLDRARALAALIRANAQ